jgi:S-DNA-T family DNA segregation ATPase FtsK/SpoIIIE
MTDTIPEVSDVGTVHNLDDRRPPADAVPVQLVKEVTTAPLPERVCFARSRQAVRVARLAATDPRTRTVARFAVRHGGYLAGGSRVVVRRTWDGRTVSAHQKMIAAAIAAGDLAAVADWQERMDQYRMQRHARRMQLLGAPQVAAKSFALGTAGTVGGLLLLGIALAVANGDVHDVLAPTLFVIDVIKWACFIAAVAWGFAKVAGLPLALFGLWAVGRHRGTAPDWALPAGRRSDDGAPITPSIVVQALRDLGIAPLKNAIKEMGDAGAGMLSPIVMAGCGVEVDVLLPSGVSSDQVQDRRRRLAENLNRHEHEVFITIPPAARSVRLWIADSGALDEPIGPSPLTFDETLTADYVKGRAPWGQDLRGDAAMPSLYQRHLLCTGLSNQGKTASLRALALWLALDPTVEFRLGDLKGIGDWSMFEGIATVLIEGPTDEHVIAVTEMLEGGVREMERRMLAPKGTAFPPLILLVDEAQVAFMCPAKGEDGRQYGGTKATSRYFNAARKLHNQGRAVSVTLWQGTQDPTDANLPKLVREGAHIRASLVLGTESQARMALGDKAIDGGAAPHKLRQGLDKGTLVVAGDHGIKMGPGQSSITVRTHFIDDDDAKAIAQRAKDRRAGITTAAATVATDEPVDHLADVFAVLGGDERVRTQEVLQRLAALNPAEYKSWTFITLKSFLEPFGAGPYKSGHMVISRERVAEALANRDNGGADNDAE